MADVNDGSAVLAPGGENAPYIPFSVRVISRSIDCMVGRIDGLLHVNHQQDSTGEFLHDGVSNRTFSAVYRLG
jgi:hypothetical protein